mmetsp:Transcript_76271/g.192006  ORF Transcript_76271/g.192006 Transcript_76271/m.192006 type:complete len:206 (+) Transcript_76271:1357-1974(+)
MLIPILGITLLLELDLMLHVLKRSHDLRPVLAAPCLFGLEAGSDVVNLRLQLVERHLPGRPFCCHELLDGVRASDDILENDLPIHCLLRHGHRHLLALQRLLRLALLDRFLALVLHSLNLGANGGHLRGQGSYLIDDYLPLKMRKFLLLALDLKRGLLHIPQGACNERGLKWVSSFLECRHQLLVRAYVLRRNVSELQRGGPADL